MEQKEEELIHQYVTNDEELKVLYEEHRGAQTAAGIVSP